MASAFQSITLRSAGYASVNQGDMTQSSQFISILFMFIGGASGSTAGGVKVGTVGILVYTVFAVSLGNKDVVLFKRHISDEIVKRAVAVVGLQIMLILSGTIAVAASTDYGVLSSLFEAAAASTTVGLTLGITPGLNLLSKIIIMLLMYLGRVGTLTVTYAVMLNLRGSGSTIKYPTANILIG